MCAVRVRGARREATGAHVDRAPWERGVDDVGRCVWGGVWFCGEETCDLPFGDPWNDLET